MIKFHPHLIPSSTLSICVNISSHSFYFYSIAGLLTQPHHLDLKRGSHPIHPVKIHPLHPVSPAYLIFTPLKQVLHAPWPHLTLFFIFIHILLSPLPSPVLYYPPLPLCNKDFVKNPTYCVSLAPAYRIHL